VLVIAITAILVLQSSPLATRVRDRARTVASLSNLRQHVAIMSSYTSDYQGLFPYLVEPSASWGVIRCESAGVAIEVPYFLATMYWNVGLADQYYSGAWRSRSFSGPFRKGLTTSTSYEMSCALIADPKFYNMETRMMPPAQLRPVRIDEAVFPSKKSMLTARYAVNHDNPRDRGDYDTINRRGGDAGFIDGHAATVRGADTLPRWMGSADGPWFGGHHGTSLPMAHQIDGIRGRDVR
jgi:hypothetical protein